MKLIFNALPSLAWGSHWLILTIQGRPQYLQQQLTDCEYLELILFSINHDISVDVGGCVIHRSDVYSDCLKLPAFVCRSNVNIWRWDDFAGTPIFRSIEKNKIIMSLVNYSCYLCAIASVQKGNFKKLCVCLKVVIHRNFFLTDYHS